MIGRDAVRAALTGPVPTIRTPFLEDGCIDYDGLRTMVDFDIDGGAKAVVLTAGDSHLIATSDQEIAQVTKAMVEHVGGRAMTVAADRWFDTKQAVAFARYCADIVVDVKPDITFVHDGNERERAPSDHGTVGRIAEHAVRSANTLLGGLSVPYGKEKYAFEVYPQTRFCPDVYIDISDVLEPVAGCINFFGALYGQSPHARGAGEAESTINIRSTGEELALGHYAAMKPCTAKFRGAHCGLRYAEAYRALDTVPLGSRLLQRIVAD